MFDEALLLDDIEVGLRFLVWNVATGEVMTTGMIVGVYDNGDPEPDVHYVDSRARVREFDLADWGVVCGDGDQNWSYLITVKIDFLDRLEVLPRLPQS